MQYQYGPAVRCPNCRGRCNFEFYGRQVQDMQCPRCIVLFKIVLKGAVWSWDFVKVQDQIKCANCADMPNNTQMVGSPHHIQGRSLHHTLFQFNRDSGLAGSFTSSLEDHTRGPFQAVQDFSAEVSG